MFNKPASYETVVAHEIAIMLGRILAKPTVTADDDFFMVGGDSLAATELMVAIEATYGIVVDPVEVFETPKLRQFGRLIAKLTADLRISSPRVLPGA